MSFTRSFDARLLSAVALAAFLIAPIGSRAQESDPVVAHANGVDIRQSDLAMAESDIGSAMPQMGPEQKRDYLITYLADVIILAQAADQQADGAALGLADMPGDLGIDFLSEAWRKHDPSGAGLVGK